MGINQVNPKSSLRLHIEGKKSNSDVKSTAKKIKFELKSSEMKSGKNKAAFYSKSSAQKSDLGT